MLEILGIGKTTEAVYQAVLARPITTAEAVRDRLHELSRAAEQEILLLVPDDAPWLDAAPSVTVRAIHPEPHRDLDHLTHLGECRTLPLPPTTMVIIDRSVALLPLDSAHPDSGSLEIRSPAVVALAAAHFDLLWSQACPLAALSPALSQLQRDLLRLLADGYTDEGAARRLGLSDRSIRRLMHDLSARLGAGSRFQTGVLACRRNWV